MNKLDMINAFQPADDKRPFDEWASEQVRISMTIFPRAIFLLFEQLLQRRRKKPSRGISATENKPEVNVADLQFFGILGRLPRHDPEALPDLHDAARRIVLAPAQPSPFFSLSPQQSLLAATLKFVELDQHCLDAIAHFYNEQDGDYEKAVQGIGSIPKLINVSPAFALAHHVAAKHAGTPSFALAADGWARLTSVLIGFETCTLASAQLARMLGVFTLAESSLIIEADDRTLDYNLDKFKSRHQLTPAATEAVRVLQGIEEVPSYLRPPMHIKADRRRTIENDELMVLASLRAASQERDFLTDDDITFAIGNRLNVTEG